VGTVRLKNNLNTPINVKITNAGIIYHYVNALPPGGQWDKDVAAIGWDLSAMYSIPQNTIDPSKDNVGAVGAIALIAFASAAAIVAAPFTAGASAVALVAFAGAVVGAGAGVAFEIASAVLYPATVTGLYGGHDYDVTVDGGFSFGNDPNGVLTVQNMSPIVISWHNRNRDTSGKETAKAH
jgi:hypothetical protein